MKDIVMLGLARRALEFARNITLWFTGDIRRLATAGIT